MSARQVYADHASTARPLPGVVEAMRPWLEDDFGNASSVHARGVRAREAVESARAEVAALIGARPEEIVFTASGSESNSLAVRGLLDLAPAGRHMSFRRHGSEVRVHLDARPLDTAHRPSVDVLFQSAAEIFGARVLGAVLTGMGSDGREGAAWIKARGGQIITESEPSCVVYGMPRSVVEAGLSDVTASLETMAGVILGRL